MAIPIAPIVEPVVEPNSELTAPEVVPGGSPSETSGTGELPGEMIQIPAFQGLLAGKPPAVSAPIVDFAKRPEGQLVQKYKAELLGAGIGFYRSFQGDLGVLFNQSYISGEDLKTADKGGKLLEIAPPFDQINQQISASGADHPILNARPPGGIKIPGAPSILPAVAPASPPAPPAPRGAIAAKIRNLALGSPTTGPKPGEGRLLNQILKPVL